MLLIRIFPARLFRVCFPSSDGETGSVSAAAPSSDLIKRCDSAHDAGETERAAAHARWRPPNKDFSRLCVFSQALIYRQGSSPHAELLGTSFWYFTSACLPNPAPEASRVSVRSLQKRSGHPVERGGLLPAQCVSCAGTQAGSDKQGRLVDGGLRRTRPDKTCCLKATRHLASASTASPR